MPDPSEEAGFYIPGATGPLSQWYEARTIAHNWNSRRRVAATPYDGEITDVKLEGNADASPIYSTR